jgi:hypothetical protein
LVEIHPVVRLGAEGLHPSVKLIAKGEAYYAGYAAADLRGTPYGTVRLRVRRRTVGGEEYLVLTGPKTGKNHFDVAALVAGLPVARPDGHRFLVDLLDGDQVIRASVPAVTVRGTRADRCLARHPLRLRDRLVLYGLLRLDIAAVLDAARPQGQEIRLPLEFIVLDSGLPEEWQVGAAAAPRCPDL